MKYYKVHGVNLDLYLRPCTKELTVVDEMSYVSYGRTDDTDGNALQILRASGTTARGRDI
jgi:hypothetical protein